MLKIHTMNRLILLTGLVCFLAFNGFAQKNGTIKGVAFDTISQQPVPAATISVVYKKDSTLLTFTMTGKNGQFELNGIPNGEFRLLITHVSYHNANNTSST